MAICSVAIAVGFVALVVFAAFGVVPNEQPVAALAFRIVVMVGIEGTVGCALLCGTATTGFLEELSSCCSRRPSSSEVMALAAGCDGLVLLVLVLLLLLCAFGTVFVADVGVGGCHMCLDCQSLKLGLSSNLLVSDVCKW